MRKLFSFAVDAGALALVLFSVAGFFGSAHFTLDLFSPFRLQYAAAALIFLCLFAAKRRRLWFAAMLLTFAANLYEVAPYLPLFSRPGSAADGTRVLFANVDVRNNEFERLRTLVKSDAPDVVVLTEVNNRWAQELRTLGEWYPYSVSDPREDKFGMLMLSRIPIAEKTVIELPGVAFPSVVFDVTLRGDRGPFRVIAAHSPAPVNVPGFENRNKMLSSLAAMVHEKNLPVVLVGDLNITPWSVFFKEFLTSSELRDSRVGRGIFPSWSYRAPPLMIPIDHCLTSSSVELNDFALTGEFGSDHSGIVCDVTAGG